MLVFRIGCIIFRARCKMKMWALRVHKSRILRWKQPSIKPNVRPLWVWGPMWLHGSYAHDTGLTYLLPFPSKCQKKKSRVINLVKLACLSINNIHVLRAHPVDFLLLMWIWSFTTMPTVPSPHLNELFLKKKCPQRAGVLNTNFILPHYTGNK